MFFVGLTPTNLNQNTLVPAANTVNMARASTPPILRRGAKSRRRKDSEEQEYILPDYEEDRVRRTPLTQIFLMK